MSTKISLTYFGMDGQGRTVKDAKADAGRKIEAALDGSYEPLILQAGGEIAVVWREPIGRWNYGFFREGRIQAVSTGAATRKLCENAARAHLGQNATDWQTCFTIDNVHPIVLELADRREILGICQWQRSYRRAVSAGLDDNNARLFLGGMTHLMTQPVPAGLEAA